MNDSQRPTPIDALDANAIEQAQRDFAFDGRFGEALQDLILPGTSYEGRLPIGDPDSIEQVRRYKEGLSTAQKILFRNSAVNKVISDVLSRH